MIKKLISISALFMTTIIWADRLSPNIYSPAGKNLVGLECFSENPKRKAPYYWIINFSKKEIWQYFSKDYLKYEVETITADDTHINWESKYGWYGSLNRATLKMRFNKQNYACEMIGAPEVEKRRLDLYTKKMNKNKL